MPQIPRYYARGRAPAPYVSPTAVARRGLAQAGVAQAAAGVAAEVKAWEDARQETQDAAEFNVATTDYAVASQRFMENQLRQPRTRMVDGKPVPAYELIMQEYEEFVSEAASTAIGRGTSKEAKLAIQQDISEAAIKQRGELAKLQRTWEIEHRQTELTASVDANIDVRNFAGARRNVEMAFQAGTINAETRELKLNDIDSREAWFEATDVLMRPDNEIEMAIQGLYTEPDSRLTIAQQSQAADMYYQELDRREDQREKVNEENVNEILKRADEARRSGNQLPSNEHAYLRTHATPSQYRTYMDERQGQLIDGRDVPELVRNYSMEIAQIGIEGTAPRKYAKRVGVLQRKMASSYAAGDLERTTYERLRDDLFNMPKTIVSSQAYKDARDFLYFQIAKVPAGQDAFFVAAILDDDTEAVDDKLTLLRDAQKAEMELSRRARETGVGFDPITAAQDILDEYRRGKQ